MDYALDANVFIEASRRYYGFTICPGFWQSLIHLHSSGRIFSIDRVKGEMVDKGDKLAAWVADEGLGTCFESSDRVDVASAYALIVGWVYAQAQFTDAAKAEFADKPDAWLIAYAKATGKILVTHEVLAPEARRRVPIPNVCQAFEVQCIDTFEMLTALETSFYWLAPA